MPELGRHRAGSVAARRLAAWAILAALLCSGAPAGQAQTLRDSLASAYSNNPSLNVARSTLRSVDENVAIARSGNRPQLAASVNALATISQTIKQPFTVQEPILDPVTGQIVGTRSRLIRRNIHGGTNPLTIGVTLTQPLFQGFTVRNSIRQAEAAVRAQRASLRNSEQNTLLDAVTAFMDVIQDRALLKLQQSNVTFLQEQVRAAKDRFEVGEGTRTDVSQAEARLAEGNASVNFARATLESSEATFRQVIGLQPKRLDNNIKVEKFLPKSLEAALSISQDQHPAIEASLHNVDTALFNVKALEGDLLPDLSLNGTLQSQFFPTSGAGRTDTAAVSLNLNIPIYQGGLASARVRQAKEDLGTARIQVDVTRDAVRQAVVTAWSSYKASLASILAARTGVFAQQLALQGVIEEQRVGQRTTLDVLISQQDLVQAQVTLVRAERDSVVAAYSLLSAVGWLAADRLALRVVEYRPKQHYEAVRDKWYGLRTPDGR